MAGDKTYIEDDFGKQHRATRIKAVAPESVVWSSNPNDYTVQVRVSGKWHRAILTYDVKDATFFDNINIDKALVTGGDGKTHTALLVSPEASEVIMSPIPTDEHSIIEGTTTGETVVNTYSENWSNVVWQDNVNVYKVLVEGSDGKKHTALLTTKGGGGSVEVIVKGVSPLALPDAIADSLSYVKAFGGTEQSGTPTPDSPIDIVSNNGVLKARHQSGLPLGYTLLDYIESSGTQYIDTGVTASNDMKGEIRGKFLSVDTTSAHLLSARKGTQGYNTMIAWNSNDGGGYFTQFASGLAYTRVVMPKDTNIHILQDVVTPTSTSTYVDSSVNTISAENVGYNLNLYINARNIDGTSVSDISTYRYYYVKIWESGTLVRDFVPAKNASNVVGMYDLVSGQFFTNAGTGDFTAGDPVSDPVEIYTDGTVETIEDTIGNTATAEMLLKVGDYQDVQSILDGVVTRKVGVLVLDGTEEIWGTVSQTPDTVTILTNCYTVVIPLGDAPIDKRRVYCTHLISSDTLPAADARQGYALLGNSSAVMPAPLTNKYAIGLGLTTRFPTIAGLKQWLADQYAAGTPVIIVYPLATETTESVAGQTLQVTDGDNVLEITQASLNNLELEAKYQAAVSLTIQEVQDANLDPNVEVTIN